MTTGTGTGATGSTGSTRVARTLLLLSCEARTGTLHVALGASGQAARIVVNAGWVHALANLGTRSNRGEDMLRSWLRAVPDDATARFEDSPSRDGWGRVTPFHPARLLRTHLAATAGVVDVGRFGGLLGLRATPHASCLLDAGEVAAVRLLDGTRDVGRLRAAGVTTADGLSRLLGFLDAGGLLAYDDAEAVRAWTVLGVAPGAPVDEIRRAYHRLARTLHPDLHPHAAPDERRALEARLHEISAAYRRLVAG